MPGRAEKAVCATGRRKRSFYCGFIELLPENIIEIVFPIIYFRERTISRKFRECVL
jgi:hypothetical protein